MLVAAVEALASQSPALKDPNQPLLPDIIHVREISVKIAKAVIKCAIAEGLAQEEGIPEDEAELDEWIRVQMWEPEYRPLTRPKHK
jgi:malate dehydrogenase (oxaloacetate-decarboxylating)